MILTPVLLRVANKKTLTNFYPRPRCVIRIEGIDSYSRKGEIILARTREYLKLSLQDSV